MNAVRDFLHGYGLCLPCPKVAHGNNACFGLCLPCPKVAHGKNAWLWIVPAMS